MKIENLRFIGTWTDILNDCRFTVHKKDLDKEPSKKFKENILIAEHSPIRSMFIKFDIRNLGACFITHLTRHTWTPFVATQRTDRTNVDRHTLPQDALNDMRCEMNIQHGIDTCRKRLCFQSSKETREAMELAKYEIHKVQPEIADVFVPNCVYRGGCPEGENCCGMFEKWLPFAHVDLVNIKERYKLYNQWLYNKYDKKELKDDN